MAVAENTFGRYASLDAVSLSDETREKGLRILASKLRDGWLHMVVVLEAFLFGSVNSCLQVGAVEGLRRVQWFFRFGGRTQKLLRAC